jgi:hypothetical protein
MAFRGFRTGARVLALVTAMASGAVGAERESGERKVPLAHAPAAVRAAFSRRLGARAPAELEVEVERGKRLWEAEFMDDGARQSLKLDEHGAVVESEKDVEPTALPEAVRKAVEASFPDARIAHAEEVHEAGRLPASYYELDLTGANVHEIKVRPDGRILR